MFYPLQILGHVAESYGAEGVMRSVEMYSSHIIVQNKQQTNKKQKNNLYNPKRKMLEPRIIIKNFQLKP